MPRYSSIAISGPPSSGKDTLVNALAEQHLMKKFSVGGMLRREHIALHPNNEPSFDVWNRGLDIEYNRKVALDAASIFNKGGVVGDSRYISFYDKDVNLLVFITADMDTRVSRSLESPRYKGQSAAEIKLALLKREQNEVKVGVELFGKDYRDPSLYHLVLNSELLGLGEEISAINGVFGRPCIYSAYTAPIDIKS